MEKCWIPNGKIEEKRKIVCGWWVSGIRTLDYFGGKLGL